MLVPLSWLLEYAALPDPVGVGEVARRLTATGLEIEGTEQVGHDISSVVVARVLEIEELTGYKKPIRYCRVTTAASSAGTAGGRGGGRICRAGHLTIGDLAPPALPRSR